MTFVERVTQPGSIWALAGDDVVQRLWWIVFVSVWDDIGRYGAAELLSTYGISLRDVQP